MKITICNISYTIKTKNNNNQSNLLSNLFQIKEKINRTLSFRSGCKSGVCGSCAVRVNGVEKLACKTTIKEGDIIEPLNYSIVIKDLIIDKKNQNDFLIKTKAYLEKKTNTLITQEDEKKIDTESNCILCNSCLSACPVYSINEKFLAPYALLRNFRYVEDAKEGEIQTKLEAIQTNGIWDCTLCGNCNMVCPSIINIKGSIENLRNKSAQFGYNNPNMNSGFDTSFGFNPNGF